MTVQVKGFQTPKNGNHKEECQDAMGWDEQNGIFAISDGVSDSAFQKLWADLLVRSFVAKVRNLESFTQDWVADWIETEQREWNSQVNWEEIPWHGKMKAQQTGGEATFLGIRLLPEKRTWIGIAIGDCNLFRFSKDRAFKESIPIKQSTVFSNDTQAFSSLHKNQAGMLSQVKMIQGTYEPGDYLILATDAVARWMLVSLEARRNPLDEIPTSTEPGAFNHWISSQRQTGSIKDDDSSLLMVQVEPVPEVIQARQTVRPAPVAPVPQRAVQPRREPARGIWTLVFLVALFVFTIAGFVLGNAWQGWRSTRRIETEVQKPLLELMSKPPSSRAILEEKILEIITNIQPDTQTACQAFCMANPKDPKCTQDTTRDQTVYSCSNGN